MRESIATYLQGKAMQTITSWAATTAGEAVLARYLTAHETAFPDLVEEVRGLAHGAKVPFNTLFAVNLQNELAHVANHSARRGATKGCSDYHLLKDGVQAWGHNEDGEPDPAISETWYFITSTITPPGGRTQSYTAFTYPGQLAGWAWGFNSHGLSQSVNALWVLSPADPAALLGVSFVARSMLEAESISDAWGRANTPNQGGGQHFNLGSISAACTPTDPCQVSIETAPDGPTMQELHSLPGGWYAHFNQYLHTDRPPLGDYLSSVHRLARSAQLSTRVGSPNSTQGILGVLRDTADPDYPLHRSDTPKDPYITLATALFDLRLNSLMVFIHKPSVLGTDSKIHTPKGSHQTMKPDLQLDLRDPLAWPT